MNKKNVVFAERQAMQYRNTMGIRPNELLLRSDCQNLLLPRVRRPIERYARRMGRPLPGINHHRVGVSKAAPRQLT